jgi:hypothetical protein
MQLAGFAFVNEASRKEIPLFMISVGRIREIPEIMYATK